MEEYPPSLEELIAKNLGAVAEAERSERVKKVALQSRGLLRPAIAEAMRVDACDAANIMTTEDCTPNMPLKRRISERHLQEDRFGLWKRKVHRTWVDAEYAEVRRVWLISRTFTVDSVTSPTKEGGDNTIYSRNQQGLAMDESGELYAFYHDFETGNNSSLDNLDYLIDDGLVSDGVLVPDICVVEDEGNINKQPALISWREHLAILASNAISGQRHIPSNFNVVGFDGPPYFYFSALGHK